MEAQLHGPLLPARDVEAIVLDPCFHDTDIEAVAARLPCAVEWHPGNCGTTSPDSVHLIRRPLTWKDDPHAEKAESDRRP